jgi:hypothetical protein
MTCLNWYLLYNLVTIWTFALLVGCGSLPVAFIVCSLVPQTAFDHGVAGLPLGRIAEE